MGMHIAQRLYVLFLQQFYNNKWWLERSHLFLGRPSWDSDKG